MSGPLGAVGALTQLPKWRMTFVGDVMLQHPLAASSVYEYFQQSQLAFANLEAPLSERGYPADKPIVFRGKPELVSELKRASFRLLSFANNHSLDFGSEAMLDTLGTLRDAGFSVAGAGRDLQEALKPAVTQVGAFRIACIALCCTLPPGFAATNVRPGVAPIRVRSSWICDGALSDEQPGTPPYVTTEVNADDVLLAQKEIQSAKDTSDIVMVSVHWGVPPGWSSSFQGPLADYQRPLAHALIEAGADVILGHHPHTLHGIEIYRGRPIFYSLGNFVFHALADRSFRLNRSVAPYRVERVRPGELRQTAVFAIDYNEAAWEKISLFPCRLNDAGEPQLADAESAGQIFSRLEGLCRELDVYLHVRDGEGFIFARA